MKKVIFLTLIFIYVIQPVRGFSDSGVLLSIPENYSSQDRLVSWIKNNVTEETQIPLSFSVPQGREEDIFSEKGGSDSVTGIIERTIVKEGLSIYDGALWQIVLSRTGKQQDLENACRLSNLYWDGKFGSLLNIRAGYGYQPFVYDVDQPQDVSSDLNHKGKRGFIFRIINANGNYNMEDPLDGKTRFANFPNWPTVHWEDWKPIAGENAWVVIAALHLYHQKFYDEQSGKYFIDRDDVELKLAEEIARAAMFLQADNGGIRMAPLGTFHHLLSLDNHQSLEGITRQLDEEAIKAPRLTSEMIKEAVLDQRFIPYFENYQWHYNEISTENNLSWYAAFRMLYQVTQKPVYQQAMRRMENYFKECWNAEEKFFYQGMHFVEGKWTPNEEFFASDVQNWSINVLSPELIDRWFGHGASMKIWKTTKAKSGIYHIDGKCLGVGYTNEQDASPLNGRQERLSPPGY